MGQNWKNSSSKLHNATIPFLLLDILSELWGQGCDEESLLVFHCYSWCEDDQKA
jgi:hypothetical protein